MDNGPSKEPEQITDSLGKKYTLLPKFPLPEGFEGPTGFLGKGAFGAVSVAYDSQFQPFAIKEINLNKSNPNIDVVLAESTKEIAYMHHLGMHAEMIHAHSDDPNLLKMYLLQPFVKGISLAKYFENLLKQSRLPQNQNDIAKMKLMQNAIASYIAALEATQKLHKIRPIHGDSNHLGASIIHGDLHNDNILYNPDTRQATIIDFGLSCMLPENETHVYIEGEDPIFQDILAPPHRAPETKVAEVRREGHSPERVYDKTSDIFSLAINFGVYSSIEEYSPDFAGAESAKLMKIFKELSQENQFLGGSGRPEDRKSLEYGIEHLKAVQNELSLRIAQKAMIDSVPLLKNKAAEIAKLNDFKINARAQGLPENLKEMIKAKSKEYHERQNLRQTVQLSESTGFPSKKRARPITPSGSPTQERNENRPTKADSKEDIKSSRDDIKKNRKLQS